MDENRIIPYVDAIFQFCFKRLGNRFDAEDLASEIICHVLDGMGKYKIESLDAWVWRIAHNRYARFIDAQNKNQTVLSGDITLFDTAADDYCDIDEEATEQEFETVFRYLHTLSSEYRNIFIDYYIGEMPVRILSEKYSLPETTIKWRLNAGRQKIRERIGESKMERIYKRINWNTTACNGSMDSDKYLHNQIARAICEAAYEKPLTIEEISLKTGIPALYIEDELPRLIYGDAVEQTGNKYATDFIILHLHERPKIDDGHLRIVGKLSDYMENLLLEKADDIRKIGFFGSDRDMSKLGYVIAHLALREKVWKLKSEVSGLNIPPYPPRKDGGYGWFIVDEVESDAAENKYESTPYMNGNNGSPDEGGYIFYYWVNKYFSNEVNSSDGMHLISGKNLIGGSTTGIVPAERLNEDELAQLLASNLIRREGKRYVYNFPIFTEDEISALRALIEINDESILDELGDSIYGIFTCVRDTLRKVVPKRLESQIDQRISCEMTDSVNEIIGYVIEELINRGVLEKPDEAVPMTNGVLYVCGPYQWL